MSRHDLTEIDLYEGDQRIRLRRGPLGTTVSAPPANTTVPAAPAATPAATSPTPTASATLPTPAATKKTHEIKSPTIGTYYSAPNPESPPFVKVGSQVKPDTVVCIIEAMKVFNEITADCSGTIVAAKIENQQPVEWGQVLFEVEPD
jgi:acetyl-CoA carboxylase biotin carboxyl carrier protein